MNSLCNSDVVIAVDCVIKHGGCPYIYESILKYVLKIFVIYFLRLHREYVHSVVMYQKYLTRLGELIIFEPWREIFISPDRARSRYF